MFLSFKIFEILMTKLLHLFNVTCSKMSKPHVIYVPNTSILADIQNYIHIYVSTQYVCVCIYVT